MTVIPMSLFEIFNLILTVILIVVTYKCKKNNKHNDNAKKELYNGMAEKMTTSLYENYTDWENDEALLIKGCTEHPKDFAALNPDKNSFTGYETSLIYGDFFFMEALMRLNGYDGLFE